LVCLTYLLSVGSAFNIFSARPSSFVAVAVF
jgi:hypothetical protein